MYSLLTEFSGSSLFPSRRWLEREDFFTLAEKTYLLLIALRVSLCVPATSHWADGFLHHTLYSGNFRQWRSGGSDLYAALWALTQGEYEAPAHVPDHIPEAAFVRWLRALSHDVNETHETKRLFLKLDSMLHINESSLKSIRRLVQDWPNLSHRDKQLATTRLLQIMRSRIPRAEVLKHLGPAARHHNLEISDACNLEDGEDCGIDVHHTGKASHNSFSRAKAQPHHNGSFLAGLAGVAAGFAGSKGLRNENATTGSTSSANVASLSSTLGDHPGFDSKGHARSIYPAPKKTPPLLRR